MTSQVKNNNLDPRPLGEEKKADGETTLSTQAQAQTPDAETTLVQQLQAAKKMKSKKLKAAQAKIKELEAMAAQAESETQDRIEDLVAQVAHVEAKIESEAEAKLAAQAQQLRSETKIKDLLAATLCVLAFAVLLIVAFASQANELKAAQARIEHFEGTMASMEAKAQSEVDSKLEAQLLAPPGLAQQLRSDYLKLDNAEYFVGHHLVRFSGKHLRIEKSGLKTEHLVQFLDDWLNGFNTVLETIIVEKGEFDRKLISEIFPFKQWNPTRNHIYISSAEQDHVNGTEYLDCSMTGTLTRPFDGVMASVAFNNNRQFYFLVWTWTK